MAERWILQFCHCHYGPFLDVARQYSALFGGSRYKILTVYLTGEASEAARQGSGSDEVIFLDFKSHDVRGLKIGAILALKKIIASRDIALIIAHRFKPIYIACLAGRLPVIGVHHAFGDYDRVPRRWFAEFFAKRLALLAVSDAVRDDLRSNLSTWPTDRIETLHNRIDAESLHIEVMTRSAARNALSLPEGAFVVGNVGRLHTDKDQATLVRGFAKALPGLPAGSLLAIMGTGPLQNNLKELATELGISGSVRFLGHVTDARRNFTAFDLFVLSSNHEPFGMVLLEAMVANVPIIATDCGGAPEVIGDTGRLFPLHDSEALAKLMLAHAREDNDETNVARIKEVTQRLHEKFSYEAAQKRFFSLPMVSDILGKQTLKLL